MKAVQLTAVYLCVRAIPLGKLVGGLSTPLKILWVGGPVKHWDSLVGDPESFVIL